MNIIRATYSIHYLNKINKKNIHPSVINVTMNVIYYKNGFDKIEKFNFN